MNIKESIEHLENNLQRWKSIQSDLTNSEIVEEIDKDYAALEVLLSRYKDLEKQFKLRMKYSHELEEALFNDSTNIKRNI